MDMGRFLIETHPRTGRPIKELAKAHDVSAGWSPRQESNPRHLHYK
jgi:hypothetical protein